MSEAVASVDSATRGRKPVTTTANPHSSSSSSCVSPVPKGAISNASTRPTSSGVVSGGTGNSSSESDLRGVGTPPPPPPPPPPVSRRASDDTAFEVSRAHMRLSDEMNTFHHTTAREMVASDDDTRLTSIARQIVSEVRASTSNVGESSQTTCTAVDVQVDPNTVSLSVGSLSYSSSGGSPKMNDNEVESQSIAAARGFSVDPTSVSSKRTPSTPAQIIKKPGDFESVESVISRVIPNLRDLAVSSCNDQMKKGLIYRSARPFGRDLAELHKVLVNLLGVVLIIDLRDEDLTPIKPENEARLFVSKFYRCQKVSQFPPNSNNSARNSPPKKKQQTDSPRTLINSATIPPQIAAMLIEDPANESVRQFCVNKKPNERRLAVINVLDSEIVKKRVMETVVGSPYLPMLVAAKVADTFAGTALAPFYFCKYFMSTHDIFESYVEMVQACGKNFGIALKLVALADGPVLFHCSLGKDRTGILAMLILYILGAPESAILFDYNLTELAEPYLQEYSYKFMKISGLSPNFCTASVETMRQTLDFITATYGSITEYLDHIGFGSNWRELLRLKYLKDYVPHYTES